MLDYLIIIQARLTSTRLPGKILMTVGGIPIVRRVWIAAKGVEHSRTDRKIRVVVGYPERYPDLDENDVRERFRRISKEFRSKYIIRLTADCPLLTPEIINDAIESFESSGRTYYCNRDLLPDGFDVQVFSSFMLHRDFATHKEHVILPEKHSTLDKYLSVDTKEDLERARAYAR